LRERRERLEVNKRVKNYEIPKELGKRGRIEYNRGENTLKEKREINECIQLTEFGIII